VGDESPQQGDQSTIENRSNFWMISVFHMRRLKELAEYEATIVNMASDYKFEKKYEDDKAILSYIRLLCQPQAYQALVLIWSNSPSFVSKFEDPKEIKPYSAYSLSKELSQNSEDINKNINYIRRVLEASSFFRLVDILSLSERKRDIIGTNKLHMLMSRYAERCIEIDR